MILRFLVCWVWVGFEQERFSAEIEPLTLGIGHSYVIFGWENAN